MNTYNEEALAEAMKLLGSTPQTIPELATRFKKSERTIKRWLEEMRRRGLRVVRDGITVESPYFIVNGSEGPEAHPTVQ